MDRAQRIQELKDVIAAQKEIIRVNQQELDRLNDFEDIETSSGLRLVYRKSNESASIIANALTKPREPGEHSRRFSLHRKNEGHE